MGLTLEVAEQLGDRLKEVGYQAIISDLKNGRLSIFVDGHNGFGALHTGEVLDGPADADGEIEIWSHHFAGLPDLEIVRHSARIADGPGSPDSTAELVGEIFNELEVLCSLQATST